MIVYGINPSVDIYKIDENQIEFYFITTRRRILLKVTPSLITSITLIDGCRSIEEIGISMSVDYHELQPFFDYLLKERVIVDVQEEQSNLSLINSSDRERYDRQLNYFRSAYSSGSTPCQKLLLESTIAIFGLGAIGSGIALELAMAGVRNFVLIDDAVLRKDNAERHYIFSNSYIGKPKVDAVESQLKAVDPNITCTKYYDFISYDADILKYLDGVSFVVNTLDEPYIGYTSAKIGRVCFKLKLPLFVAGGFDAHLMSTGELIIPEKTPCVDCYLEYFTTTLSGWKPRYNITNQSADETIPNKDFQVGGLASMSLFSISYAAMTIIDYIVSQGLVRNVYGRGECLFEDLSINYLNVKRNPNCPICGTH